MNLKQFLIYKLWKKKSYPEREDRIFNNNQVILYRESE